MNKANPIAAVRSGHIGATLLLVLLGIGGCTFWHNFTTYFNVDYLAKWHLQQYEEELHGTPISNAQNGATATLSHRWLDEEYQTRQNAIADGRRQTIQPSFAEAQTWGKNVNSMHLDSAIILGSKILADKKSVKYIEDALYVVGKAQYYKGDFSGSKRKFLELLYRYPDTKYGSEVQVLLARSMLTGRNLDTAKNALGVALQEATVSKDIKSIAEVHRAMAEYYYAQNPDTLRAIAEELKLSEEGLNGDERSKVEFEEGAVEYMNADWSGAESAFRRSTLSASDDAIAGESHVALALALRRQAKFDEAAKELQLVLSKSKYGNSHPAAKYELAYTADIKARSEVHGDLRSKAFQTVLFPEVDRNYYTVDTTYARESLPITSRSKFRQAEMLREMGNYDSASRIAVSLIGTKEFGSESMNAYVSERMRALAGFSKWREALHSLDSQELAIRAAPKKVASRTVSPDAAAKGEIHMMAVREVLGPRFRADKPVTLNRDDSIRIMQVEERLSKIPPAPMANDTAKLFDSLHYREAGLHFDLGRAYESFAELPSAVEEYKATLGYRFAQSDSATDALRAQTLYAWLQLESRRNNKAVKDSLYHALETFYGQTMYAQQAMQLFGAGRDQTSPAEVAYREAYSVLKSSGLDAAKARLLQVSSQFVHEDAAPRALFAIGEGYEEISRYDSAVKYYREVLTNYPFSEYAKSLRPRLADAGPGHPAPPTGLITPNEIKSQQEKQMQELERARRVRQMQQHQQGNGMPGQFNVPQQAPIQEENRGPSGGPAVPPPPPPPPLPFPKTDSVSTKRPVKHP